MKKLQDFFFLPIIIFLLGCSATPKSTPTPLPTPTVGKQVAITPNGIRASGVVVPVQKARLSFALNGQIQKLYVKEGDEVTAGQVIAELANKESLQAAVTAAELDVLSAQQALEDLHANAALAKAQALTQVSQAYAAVREAQYQLYYFLSSSGISDTDPIHAMEISQQELQKARQEFDQVRFKPENDPLRRTLKERLDNAESSQQNALRRLELEAQLQTAQANLDLAKDAYNRLKDGADPRQVALAEARLKDAQARLAMAQATLAQASLTAPFSGTITTLEANVGETVLAGSVVAVLGDLQEFRVETSDLSEIDIKDVQIGQKVQVRIEALNQDVNGRVIQIAPQSNTLGGDVVYTVVIALDEKPDGLRWGMSAEVEIITE